MHRTWQRALDHGDEGQRVYEDFVHPRYTDDERDSNGREEGVYRGSNRSQQLAAWMIARNRGLVG